MEKEQNRGKTGCNWRLFFGKKVEGIGEHLQVLPAYRNRGSKKVGVAPQVRPFLFTWLGQGISRTPRIVGEIHVAAKISTLFLLPY